MEQIDLEMYDDSMVELRKYCKWHPWMQVTAWILDWEFEHYNGDWTVAQMREYCQARYERCKQDLQEVNDAPLFDELIYPDKIGWIWFILRDMRQLQWVYQTDRRKGLWHTSSPTCADEPAEWLASQFGDIVGQEMRQRKMTYRQQSVNYDWDIRIPEDWDDLTGLGLVEHQDFFGGY